MNRRSWMIFGVIITVMVLIGIIGVTAANLNDTETSSGDVVRAINWYDYGYGYRKSITITSSVALTDYELKLVIDTQALVTAGKMQSDLDDLVFTTSDGVTEIYYYVEMNNASLPNASTVIWVRVPSIANGSTTIYVYYGKASATATAYKDGWNTFIFFDDFETTTGSPPQFPNWTRSNTGTFTQVATHVVGSYGGRFDDTAGSNAFTITSIAFRVPATNPVIVEYYAYPEQTNYDMETRVQRGTTMGPNVRFGLTGNIEYYTPASPAGWYSIGAPAGYSASTWYTFTLDEIRYTSGSANDNFDLWVDAYPTPPTLRNSNIRYRTDLNNLVDRLAFRGSASSDQANMILDCVKVRQWVSSVPTYITGAEESL